MQVWTYQLLEELGHPQLMVRVRHRGTFRQDVCKPDGLDKKGEVQTTLVELVEVRAAHGVRNVLAEGG